MPFEYQPYHSPFATTIADLILRRGDIAAQRSEQIGNALAHSALASGQAWAGAANNIGQMIGVLPQQIAQAKTQGLNQQLLAGRVADENQLRKGQASVDAMMQGDQLAPGAVGPRQESYLDQNGLFDIGKMTQALGQGGMGHLAPDLLKGAESINDSILKHQQLEQAAAQQHAIVLGDTAAGVLKLADSGVPIPQALDFAVQPLLATKRIDPAEYQQVKAQIVALPPEQQRAALTTFMDQAAKLDKGENLAEGAQHVDRYGRVTAQGGAKAPTTAVLAERAANGDPAAKAALALLHPEKPDTAAQDDQRYEHIVQARTLNQPVSAEDAAFVKAYEQRKTLGIDKSAAAAADRQTATINAQIAQQGRAQSFAEAQAGRKELTEKVEQPYQDAQEKAATLRSFLAAAANGNKVAGSVTPLLATLGLVTSEGVKRINATEVNQIQGAGSLMDRIKGKVGKIVTGQPIPADLRDDIGKLSDMLEQGARTKYEQGFTSITKRYGLNDERMLAPSNAPPEGTTRDGATWGYRNGKWGWWK